MALGADRYATRGDTFVLLCCVALSLVAMSLPEQVRVPVASGLRRTVLWPLLQLQTQSEQLRTSKTRYSEVVAERDSASLAATFLGELRAENVRLRALIGLGQRLGPGFVPAEVLHQATPTDPLTVVISAGSRRGVTILAPVVAPEGLLGMVSEAEPRTSVVTTWANPEFRASGMAADGSVYGIVAPHGMKGPDTWLLELRGVPYRQDVPVGTVILTSGLGGVLPRGIPVGTVIALASESGWERTYLVRPAVAPGAVSHVMVLVGSRTADLRQAFLPDTAKAARPDSARTRVAPDTTRRRSAVRRDTVRQAAPPAPDTVRPDSVVTPDSTKRP
ncbi:MAG TPA: rod shape-determining protein MreC [Gemmatimonadales bacterium]|nr:rod shape-determining protein MreC [Gemmatimonadales bacterium]